MRGVENPESRFLHEGSGRTARRSKSYPTSNVRPCTPAKQSEVDDRLQLQVVVVERHHHAAAGRHHRVASDGREADLRVVVGEEELHAFFVRREHEASIR